jgi:hypothetical protein
MIFNSLKQKADIGMTGRNAGLPMGLPELENLVNSVQRGRYDLIAGKTSAGKTAFVDQCYVLNPFDYYLAKKDELNIEVDWLYFSLEIAPVNKFAKFAARELNRTYGVESSLAEILSLGKHRLSPEKRAMLDSCDNYFKQLEDRLHIFDSFDTPDEIDAVIRQFYEKYGSFKTVKGREIYTPLHPNHYVIIIIDTINLITPDGRDNLKQAIDKLSKRLIWYRNICDASPVVLQQYNAQIIDPIRIQQKRTEPIVDDLEDSKRTSKDCNTYFSVFDPSELALNKSPGGYDLNKFGKRFRQIKVHKNRDGERDKRVGCMFKGALGQFIELPPVNQMTSEDYEHFNNLA